MKDLNKTMLNYKIKNNKELLENLERICEQKHQGSYICFEWKYSKMELEYIESYEFMNKQEQEEYHNSIYPVFDLFIDKEFALNYLINYYELEIERLENYDETDELKDIKYNLKYCQRKMMAELT